MGQTNLERTIFKARVQITNPKNDDKQDVGFTGYFEIGDVVDVWDVDADGNRISILADNLTILSISPNNFVVLSAVVDTTAATVTPYLVCQQIDDGQEAVDRLYKRKLRGDIDFPVVQSILAQALNSPVAGKATYDVDDVSFFKAGDKVDLLADEGVIATDVVIDSVNPNADDSNNRATIVLLTSVDTSTFTNPFLLTKDVTIDDAIRRNQSRLDEVDRPRENEDLGLGNAIQTVWEFPSLFVQNSSKLFLDGRKLKKGLVGTRSTLSQGAGNAGLIFTSNVLGDDGDKTTVEVQNGAGFTIALSGNFSSGQAILINDNGGAATSEEIADALNADANVRKIVNTQFSGDGTGVVAVFGPTALAGGSHAGGSGDYAELEQEFENLIANTGYKIIALRIRPNERNRLNKPPADDEELECAYREPMENIDR